MHKNNMVSHADNWIRIYDIPETSQHKRGFTIYKIISMLYPERCPDAVTRITVWKRYNEFKKLHKELKSKHRALCLKDKYPTLPSHPFFKRFNADVILERRAAILYFLEYIAKERELFMSDVFVKFFETSHTPSNLLNSSINSIRSDLHLPCEFESFTSGISDSDERTLSDTDSVSTLSSINTQVDLLVDPLRKSTTPLTKLCKKISSESLAPVDENISVYSSSSKSTPSLPPDTSSIFNDDFTGEYIVEAARFITEATEMESEKYYEKAFAAYKRGIDILLNNVKYDKNIDRREQVRFKVEKYLLRAEKIYNLHLSPEMKKITEITKCEVQDVSVRKPLTELYKYKAIKIIESGILVIHSETQELFYVKAIHKTCRYSNDYLILPDNVPYMIQLRNYYDCENAIFLILQHSSGVKLLDYVKRTSIQHSDSDFNGYYPESDNDSEGSYSDLINDYAAGKSQKSEDRPLKRSDCKDAKMNFFEDTEEIKHAKKELLRRKSSDRSSYDIEYRSFVANIDDVVKWMAQLLLALEKLHVLGVVCCDLNLNNLLVDENGDLVLTYMCSVSQEKVFNNNDISIAPELYTLDKVNSAVDWWSYGTIFYELLAGVPLKCVHPEGFTTYTLLKVPKYVSPEGRSLLKQLLVYEPKERLGCSANGTEDIKSHPFFNAVSWEHLAHKCI